MGYPVHSTFYACIRTFKFGVRLFDFCRLTGIYESQRKNISDRMVCRIRYFGNPDRAGGADPTSFFEKPAREIFIDCNHNNTVYSIVPTSYTNSANFRFRATADIVLWLDVTHRRRVYKFSRNT